MSSTEVLNRKFVHVPRTAFVASVILHLCLPAGIITLKVLDYFNVHPFTKHAPVKQVYQEFIQVDMVALPDALLKDLDKTDATLDVVENPKTETELKAEEKPMPKDDVLIDPTKVKAEEKKKLEAAEKEKVAKAKKEEAAKEKALKKLQEEASREAALKALNKRDGKSGRQKISGNLLSKGTSTTGMIGAARDRYVSLIAQKIKEHFNIFSWQRKKGLVSVVYIEIFPTGRLREKRVVKRSADPLYDSAVLQAIEDAQPLPVPEDLSIINEGITVEFRPEG